ncbi:hypothetical protein MMC14_004998 [Varicellaria rhodocarpa]|nr:hypothetical protein [Varicellaria rhodocarpa]
MPMDGVNCITQCPIAENDYFVYKFKVTQYGSSRYHSHYSVQYADGAIGPISLQGPSSAKYDEAISPPLIMTDWGHNSACEAVNTGKLRYENTLLNGLGNVTRFNNKTPNEATIKNPFQITFEGPQPGQRSKKHLLRIINLSFNTTFKFTIDNHELQIVSADFVPIQPYTRKLVFVGIGQRYNVIVTANLLIHNNTDSLPDNRNYWMRTYISPCKFSSNACDPTDDASCGYERTGILRSNSPSKANPSSEL